MEKIEKADYIFRRIRVKATHVGGIRLPLGGRGPVFSFHLFFLLDFCKKL